MVQQVIALRDIHLPEFDKNQRIAQQKALIFDSNKCQYDMILGTNFLSKTGIKLYYDQGEMLRYDNTLPMHPRRGLTSVDFDGMEDSDFIQYEDELLGQDGLKLYATEILDAKYQWNDVRDVVENQHHLTASQKCNLRTYSNITRNYLMALSVSIHIRRFTSKLNPMQNLCMHDHIPCLKYICPCSNVN
jgi:hypothetical protein